MKKQTVTCGCTEDGLGYLAWHYDAERRYRRGQRQVYCTACRKWRWPDHVGRAPTLTKAQFDRAEALGRGR